jgi:pimeloyl-ACP methyl ester carboxylesterase
MIKYDCKRIKRRWGGLKVNYVNVKNGRIYYELYGNGETVIFLHGNGQNLNYFDSQIEFFRSRYQVLAIDSRGHGKSSVEKNDLNISLMADDVISVMNQIGIEKAHVIGFSDGGNISLELAIRFPGRFLSMIIVGANLYPKGMKFSVLSAIWMYYLYLSLKSKFDSSSARKRNVIGLMVNQPKFDHGSIKSIKTPLYVIAGEKDIIKYKHTALIAELLPNAKLTVISGASHFIPSENSKEFNRLAFDFIKNLN